MAVPLTLRALLSRIDALAGENASALSTDGAVAMGRAALEVSPVVRMHAVIEALLAEQSVAALDSDPLEVLVGCLRECVSKGLPARYGQDYPAALAAAAALLPADPV